jgi:hypothetical protein
MEGKKDVAGGVISKYVVYYGKGSVISNDENPGTGVYSVLRGRLAIRKGEKRSP